MGDRSTEFHLEAPGGPWRPLDSLETPGWRTKSVSVSEAHLQALLHGFLAWPNVFVWQGTLVVWHGVGLCDVCECVWLGMA